MQSADAEHVGAAAPPDICSSRSISRPPRRRVSRAVGRLMIDVGSRLAADPFSERARSR